MNYFVYFLLECVLMLTWRFAVMSCVCPLINYTLATGENVRNVRVCACCNHFLITWNEFYHNTQPETISNICTRYIFIPPANFVCGGVFKFVVGYTVFTLSVCVCVCVCASVSASVCLSVRPSVTFCFFNILRSHCWIFIKPCKHVHICKTNTLDKKVRARGQFY